MNESIIAALDTEIAKLQKARQLLTNAVSIKLPVVTKQRGRPKGSKNAVKIAPVAAKRTMSAEGRARVAAAQKKRWAAQKKAA